MFRAVSTIIATKNELEAEGESALGHGVTYDSTSGMCVET
jgi:hypothetical protein